jgi:hypothetical protein
MPVLNPSIDSDPSQHIYLCEEITGTIAKELSAFSLFIFTMKLVVEGDRHRQSTKKYVQDNGSDYNFCLIHEKIGREITIMLKSSSKQEYLDGPDNELRVLTCIIIIGARIDWLKTAIIGSQKAEFLGPIAKEYRTSCVAVTNAMCDLLLQADVTDAKQVSVSQFFLIPFTIFPFLNITANHLNQRHRSLTCVLLC